MLSETLAFTDRNLLKELGLRQAAMSGNGAKYEVFWSSDLTGIRPYTTL